MNNNPYNKNILPKENINKKENIISSLNEVENFLNNFSCLFSSIKFVNLLKKFK